MRRREDKVLKDRRSPRRRGRTGTSARDAPLNVFACSFRAASNSSDARSLTRVIAHTARTKKRRRSVEVSRNREAGGVAARASGWGRRDERTDGKGKKSFSTRSVARKPFNTDILWFIGQLKGDAIKC